MGNIDLINQFKRFIDKANSIVDSAISSRPDDFSTFLDKARKIVLSQIRHTLAVHGERFEALCRWLIPGSNDILAIAGISRFEDPYTKLIQWMLYPPGRADLALRCQKAWLKILNLQFGEDIEVAIKPITQMRTDDGQTDLVLQYKRPRILLIIESKVLSQEHKAPSGSSQTRAYPIAARKKFGLPDDYPTKMIFLTPDGISASNPSAINATFEDLVIAIATTLSPDEMGFDLRIGYSMIISHLLTHVATFSLDTSEALSELKTYIGVSASQLSDEQIMSRLELIGPVCRSLERGAKK